MSAPKWQPATLYPKGSIVQPLTPIPSAPVPLANGDFAAGFTNWTPNANTIIDASGGFQGGPCVQFNNTGGLTSLPHDGAVVVPGQVITVWAMYLQGAAPAGANAGWVRLEWYDASDVLISGVDGTANADSSGGQWHQVTVSAAAPANAAKVKAVLQVQRNNSNPSKFDSVTWSYVSPGSIPGLIYRAVQDAVGLSGSVEPTWPVVNGVQVVDNEVTWEAAFATRVEWTAHPWFISGAVEPVWPTAPGALVADNTINWQAVTREITDANCPHSKVGFILASKVFAADGDIVRFCATLNAKDWTSENDAGFLATGLQAANANDMAVLNQFRGNLAALNANGFQNWIADPDPAAMTMLDQMPGLGSTYQHAAQAVVNDLFLLTAVGVRSITIAAGAENLAGGDIGEPIDPLVQEAIAILEGAGLPVRSTYYPGQGQYWLAFPGQPGRGESTVYVHTARKGGGSWSEFRFPYEIKGFAQLANHLYLLCKQTDGAGVSIGPDFIARVERGVHVDAIIEAAGEAWAWSTAPFEGIVEWLHIDTTTPGFTGELEAVDVVATGQAPSFDIGYDQRDPDVRTTPYQLEGADTLPGCPVPFPVAAPTMAPRLTFAGGEAWSVQSVILYFFQQGDQP